MLHTKKGRYKGEFKNNYPWGKGELTVKNGDSYEGDWIEGRKEGYGIYKSKGDFYEGFYRKDKKEGRGKYYFA